MATVISQGPASPGLDSHDLPEPEAGPPPEPPSLAQPPPDLAGLAELDSDGITL